MEAAKENFEKIKLERVPLDKDGNILINLFIYLPTSDRFVRFIAKGNPVEESRLALLDTHADKDLFHLPSELTAARREELESREYGAYVERKSMHDFGEKKFIAGSKEADGGVTRFTGDAGGDGSTATQFSSIEKPTSGADAISVESQKDLNELYKKLLTGGDGAMVDVLARLETQVDLILNALVPEVKDLKGHLVRNLTHLMLMNDVSAITSIAVLCALAQGYDSKKSFRDLTYACLIMDSSLAEFSEAELSTYYRNPAELPDEVLTKMRKHPAKSFEMAESKLKSISDVSMQLILNHHELFNGRGYPRGVRSESLFPMVKVLALAVDIFESMKSAQLNNTQTTLNQIIIGSLEEHLEPHLRRHSRKVVAQLLKYLDIDPKLPEKNLLKVLNFGPDGDGSTPPAGAT